MSNIKTDCTDCVFAQKEDNIQIGCSMERLDLLGVETLSNEGNFTLKRFCNTYRPEEWLQSLDFDDTMNPEETVLQEVFPRVGFFVRLDTSEDIGYGTAIESLKQTIESIDQVGPAYIAVITSQVEYSEEVWAILVQHFGHTDIKYHVVQLETKPKEVMVFIDEAFAHAQNGWIYSTTSGESVPSDTLTKLHELTNIKMKQLVMIEPYDDFNGLIFPAFLFKFLHGNKTKLFSDENLDSRSFRQKVKAAEKRGKTKNILTWEEFNAS